MTDDLDRQREAGKQKAEEEKKEEPQKGYQTILTQEIKSGLDEIERPARGLFLSGLSAGLDISFTLLLMAVLRTRIEGRGFSELAQEALLAASYTVGFLFVVIGRSELFTEHTTLAVLPVLDRRASLRQLARLWGLVYGSNLLGTAAFAGLAVLVGPALHVVDVAVFGRIAGEVVGHPSWVMLLSAVLAGWLMGLLSWLVAASRDTIGQIFIVALVTFSIGFAHLHHSIVGSTEVLAGVFSGQGATFLDFARFLALSTVGNALGGLVFVALIKYGHASRGAS
jgi:formate/nitrite transporter FocA (FNT family)